MSRSLNWCPYCEDWWDDAHWYVGGDTGASMYPDDKCETNYYRTTGTTHTYHLCVDGVWREGKTAECPLHPKQKPRRRVKGADTR